MSLDLEKPNITRWLAKKSPNGDGRWCSSILPLNFGGGKSSDGGQSNAPGMKNPQFGL